MILSESDNDRWNINGRLMIGNNNQRTTLWYFFQPSKSNSGTQNPKTIKQTIIQHINGFFTNRIAPNPSGDHLNRVKDDQQQSKSEQIDGSKEIGKQFFDHGCFFFMRLQNNQKFQGLENEFIPIRSLFKILKADQF